MIEGGCATPAPFRGLDGLQAAESFLASLGGAVDGEAVLVNPAGRILASSGSQSGPVPGGDYFKGCYPPVIPGLRDLLEGRRRFFSYEYSRMEQGGTRWFRLRASPWRQGDHAGALIILTDFTGEHEMAARAQVRLALVASNTTNAVVITNAAGQVEWVNEGFTATTGYTLAEMVGRKPGDVLQGPDTDARTVARIREALRRGESVVEDLLNYHRDGHTYWINVKIDPLIGIDGSTEGFIAIQSDVTERRRAEIMQRAVLSSAAWAIISTDVDGIIRVFNPAAERMLGYTAEEMVGRRTFSAFHDPLEIHRRAEGLSLEEGVTVEPGFEVFVRKPRQTGQPEHREWTYIARDGRRIPVRLAMTAMRDSRGSLTGFLGLAQDISEQVEAEQALRKSKEELEATNAQLSETIAHAQELASQSSAANAAKSMFLANMSHEIRTPINGVLGMIGLLLDTRLDSEQRGFAETARVSGENLLQLINDILDFSKIEAGKLSLESIDFDLGDVVEEALDLLALRAHERGLELAAVLAPGTPRRVRGDPGRVRQVLVNLLSNAVKFTERGDVVVRVGPRPSADGRTLFGFTVADTGVGIPADRAGQLFQPFTQVDSSTTRRYGGTGLGLAISRQLVELMGGEISLQSRPGAGSTFSFTLPLDVEIAPAAEPQWSGRRVLVIEPHRPSADQLAMLLDEAGARCEVASSVVEVIDRLTAPADPRCDVLMISDRTPSAKEALAAALSPRAARLPVVVLASLAGRAPLAGAAATLAKPARRATLHRTLATVFSHAHRAPLPPAPPRPVSRGGWRLLLVEDNSVNQRVALAILGRLGYRTDAVANGREAVNALCRTPYDLVLMDCQMPEMDGYEATVAIRAPGSAVLNPEIPIIAMTANALKGDRERCLECGMNDYLSKPIDPKLLAEHLARHLSALSSPAQPPPAVDWAEFMDRVGGDEALAHELMDQFRREIAGYLERAVAAKASGEPTALARALHAMKGAAANFSAKGLHLAAVEAETALACDLDLAPAFSVLADQVKAVLAGNAPPATARA